MGAVFVALSGARYDRAVEVSQQRDLAAALSALVGHRPGATVRT